MEQNIVIENLKEQHIEHIVEIEELSFSAPWSRDAFLQELHANDKAIYVVAIEKDRVIGYGGMWKIIDEGHITNIAVHPQYRKKKIGSQIIKAMFRIAQEVDIHSLTLEVRKSNGAAQALYKKYGFVSEGVRKNYYEDNREDAVIMWKYDV